MQVFETATSLQKQINSIRASGKTVGLVPTMGNLHSGHLALVKQAKQHCDYVLATLFVNPMQFGPGEDFASYPKTLEQDKKSLLSENCDGLFLPSVKEMYPNGLENQTVISVPELSLLHCGKSRPGHFDGVCTVVSKLFNLSLPDKAFFGSKDFQQLLIIKKMVADLCMPIEIIGVPIQRNQQGLALSSRNSYLSDEQKNIAVELSVCLNRAKDQVLAEPTITKNYQAIEQAAITELNSAGMTVDYFNICHAQTLEPATDKDRHLVILAAAYLGKTRLIDNIEITNLS